MFSDAWEGAERRDTETPESIIGYRVERAGIYRLRRAIRAIRVAVSGTREPKAVKRHGRNAAVTVRYENAAHRLRGEGRHRCAGQKASQSE